MRPLYPLIPFALALVLAGSARAEGVSVALDHSERLNVHGAAANVVVGNPAVADVTVVDSHTLYVLGRSYGSTGVTITDALGRTLYAGDVTVVRPLNSVSIYRGVARADFACAQTCAEAKSAAAAGAGGGGDSDASGGAAASQK